MRRPSAYRVFLTRKSEYHVRSHVCFGVRDRRTGAFRADHWALGRALAGAFADARGALCSLDPPQVNEPLCFMVGGEPHYTSAVLAIEEREQLELPRHTRISPRLHAALARRPAGTIHETY
jgi:hypothetical protein